MLLAFLRYYVIMKTFCSGEHKSTSVVLFCSLKQSQTTISGYLLFDSFFHMDKSFLEDLEAQVREVEELVLGCSERSGFSFD